MGGGLVSRICDGAGVVRNKILDSTFYGTTINFIINLLNVFNYLYILMAERTGLEPATFGVTGRYSNQLNYRSAIHNFGGC